jgi:hypothetical protein
VSDFTHAGLHVDQDDGIAYCGPAGCLVGDGAADCGGLRNGGGEEGAEGNGEKSFLFRFHSRNVFLVFLGKKEQKKQQQIPFGYAQGRLSTSLRFAQDDKLGRRLKPAPRASLGLLQMLDFGEQQGRFIF